MLMTPVSTMLLKFVVRRVNLPALFLKIAPQFFFVARNLISTVGFIPTMSALILINREIRNQGSIQNIINTIWHARYPLVFGRFFEVIAADWKQIIIYSASINKYAPLYWFGIILSSFLSKTFRLLKFSLGLIASSLGIFYSEIFSAGSLIKDLSKHFLSFVQDLTKIELIKSDSIWDLFSKDKNSYFSFLILFILGLLGFTGVLLFVDSSHPEVIEKVPALNTYLDFIKSLASNVSNWFQGTWNSNKVPQPTPEEIEMTERHLRYDPNYTDPIQSTSHRSRKLNSL